MRASPTTYQQLPIYILYSTLHYSYLPEVAFVLHNVFDILSITRHIAHDTAVRYNRREGYGS